MLPFAGADGSPPPSHPFSRLCAITTIINNNNNNNNNDNDINKDMTIITTMTTTMTMILTTTTTTITMTMTITELVSPRMREGKLSQDKQ